MTYIGVVDIDLFEDGCFFHRSIAHKTIWWMIIDQGHEWALWEQRSAERGCLVAYIILKLLAFMAILVGKLIIIDLQNMQKFDKSMIS